MLVFQMRKTLRIMMLSIVAMNFVFDDAVVNKGDVIQVLIDNLEAYLDPMIADGKDLAKIRERISEKFPGLTFELIVEKGNGGGGGRIEIIENPEGISEEDFLYCI